MCRKLGQEVALGVPRGILAAMATGLCTHKRRGAPDAAQTGVADGLGEPPLTAAFK